MPRYVAVGSLLLLRWLSPSISSPPGPGAQGQFEWQPRDRETICRRERGLDDESKKLRQPEISRG